MAGGLSVGSWHDAGVCSQKVRLADLHLGGIDEQLFLRVIDLGVAPAQRLQGSFCAQRLHSKK